MAFFTPGNEQLIEMYGHDWEEKILKYYGSDSNIWKRLGSPTSGISFQEVSRALEDIPKMQPMKSISGSNLGLDYKTPVGYAYAFDDPSLDPSNWQVVVDGVDSNSLVPAFDGSQPNYSFPSHVRQQDGQYFFDGGAKTAGGDTVATIADKIKLADVGVRLGAKLGLKIDEALYSINPDFWDEHFPTLNPETWEELAGQSEVGDFFLRELLGIDPDGKLQGYLSEEALAYTYMVLRDNGAFGESYDLPDYQTSGAVNITGSLTAYQLLNLAISKLNYPVSISSAVYTAFDSWIAANDTDWYNATVGPNATSGSIISIRALKKRNNPVSLGNYSMSSALFSFEGRLVDGVLVLSSESHTTGFALSADYYLGEDLSNPNNYRLYGLNGTATSGLDGVSPLPPDRAPYGVPSPSVINGSTVPEVLSQLQENYPDLFRDAITEATLQEDGTVKERTYVPVGQLDPDQIGKIDPTTGLMSQDDTEVKPETLQKIEQEQDKTPQPPDTGTGKTPGVVIPTGSASSLWAVYHPTQAELNAFGAWLWSSDFVDQIKRLFNDPMQAIIGVHKVFAPIPTGGTATIKCGYLDSGVSSATVSSQYTEVNCGSIRCNEYFGNVFDYDPYTRVSIYLPFIGVVQLKTSEVMRSTVKVTYGVDVITGACLAKVHITRDGGGGILYSYGGSCACHYPVSSGSYSGIISGIVTAAVGVGTGIATGNPISAVSGVVGGISQMHTEVKHSGGFTGCSGAMGPKKPYLIINRPQTRLAANFENFFGKGSNSTTFINECSGFVRAKECHFSSQRAFDDESKEIVNLLKSGILIN